MTFRMWLARQEHREGDPLGDLARDARDDQRFAATGWSTSNDLLARMHMLGACTAALETQSEAATLYDEFVEQELESTGPIV